MTGWPDLTLTEMAAALRAGEVTSEAVTAAHLDRVAAWQPRVNAFVAVEAEAAMEAARRADRARADRARAAGTSAGPLHGVPLAHKDLFARGGRTVTAGSRLLDGAPPMGTATVLRRLEEAGAVTLGTLNLSEFAAYSTGENRHLGDCRNPWDAGRITGGSSSGSAAAVAARLVPASLGSDTGGSNRTPAALCGVTGLKPTHGLISRHGMIPRAWSLDTVGITARGAADVALMLSVVAGRDPADATSRDAPVPDYPALLSRSVAGTRVDVLAGEAVVASAEVAACVQAALPVLGDAGAVLGRVVLDAVEPGWAMLSALADVVMKAEAVALHGRWMKSRPDAYSPPVFARNEPGFHLPASRYAEVLAMRGRLTEAFVASAFARADVLALPTVPVTAPTFGEVRSDDSVSVARVVGRLTPNVRPVNILGLPAITVPCGFADGLPVGMQMIGRPFGEARLLALAHAFQARTEWHRRAPGRA